MLYFVVGETESHLIAIGGEAPPRISTITADETQARDLGISPGPLHAGQLRAAIVGAQGLLGKLSDSRVPDATAPLASLFKALIPDTERRDLAAERFQQLIIVADGALASFPFEAMIVEMDPTAKYLLDVGPPILYAPSATVLLNLAERPVAKGKGNVTVLTVGDALYQHPAPSGGRGSRGVLDRVDARYGRLGGRLQPLPFTGAESRAVAEAFRRIGAEVATLEGAAATEAHVRSQVAGTTCVHLACHGLADDAYGNLFGALVLTPGPTADADPADDGFLTLGELHSLDMQASELAILSACNTNAGPLHPG